jgi:hypothetical protein
MDKPCTNCGPDRKYWRPDCPVCKGTGVIKVKNEPMDNQLPAEVLEEIKKGAQGTLARASSDLKYSAGYFDGYYAGATEYATKLHQAEQCNTELRIANTKMRNLLEKVASRHESCWVVDKELLTEIKKFLHGK